MTDADYTLTTANGAADQARSMMLNMTGTLTAARNVICPTASKLYFIKNATTGGFAITLKTSGGTGISIPNGRSMVLMCDGVNVREAVDFTTTVNATNLAYTGTLTGGTGIVNLGSGQFYKDASGNIGVGTTTPTVKLDVIGAGDGGLQYRTGTRTVGIGQTSSEASVYWGSTTPLTFFSGSERMRIDSSGNVGIGGTPTSKLHVFGTFRQNDATNSYGYTATTGSNKNTFAAITGGGYFAWQVNNSGVDSLTLDASGNVGIGTTNVNQKLVVSNAGAAGLEIGPLIINSAPALVSYNRSGGAYLQLTSVALQHVFQSGSTPTESMRIDNIGNVGVGTASPGARLEVSGASNAAEVRLRSTDTTPANLRAYVNTVEVGKIAFLTGNNMVMETGGTERMRIDSSGNVRIGTTTALAGAGEKFSINENSTGFAQFMVQNNNSGYGLGILGQNSVYFYATAGGVVGTISNNGTTTTYATTSDSRLKTNVVDAVDAATLIDSIKVRSFDWISNNSHQRYGMVAQELAEVVPEAVHTPANPEEMMAVDYSKLVPLLVKEIQSLRARVAALEL
jgi:hypothetical protein